jgi:hypothetical protein
LVCQEIEMVLLLPAELMDMVKSFLSNRDLFTIERTCQYMFFVNITRKQKHLRKCRLWNVAPAKIKSKITSLTNRLCGHVACWKILTRHVSLQDLRMYQNRVIREMIRKGHYDVLKLLCDKYPITKDDVKCSEFTNLAREGHLPVIEYLFDKYTLATEYGKSVLREAAEFGHLPLVQYVCGVCEFTAADILPSEEPADFVWGAKNGHLPVVQYLCEKYKPDILDNVRRIIITRIAQNGHLEILKYFCDLYSTTSDDIELRAVSLAAAKGHLEVVQYLCDTYDLGIEYIRHDNYFAMREAAIWGHLPIIRFFCERFDLHLEFICQIDHSGQIQQSD